MRRQKTFTQKQALEYATSRSRIALFMAMRLGKTLVSIRWASALGGPCLVIAPKTIHSQWVNELEQESIEVVQLQNSKHCQDVFYYEAFFLITPQLIRNNTYLLNSSIFRSVIFDESVIIKNSRAKITKAMVNETTIQARCLLSGNPSPENSLELIPQLIWCFESFMGWDNPWKAQEALTVEGPFGQRVVRRDMRKRIKAWLSTHCFVRSQKDAGFEVKKTFKLVKIKANKKQREELRKIKELWEFGDRETKHSISLEQWLRRLSGGFKPVEERWELISSKKVSRVVRLALEGKRFVCWCVFSAELATLLIELQKSGVTAAIINGALSNQARSIVLESFNSGDVQVLLMQVKCGLYGLTLNCSEAVYYSLPWSNNEWTQSKERIVLFNKSTVTYHILMTEETGDADVYQALKMKSFQSKSIIKKVIE